MGDNQIRAIVDESICIGCEACIPLCPNKALTMKVVSPKSLNRFVMDADTVYMDVRRRP